MRTFFIRIAKFLLFKSPFWRFFLPVMKFDMSISQLNFITNTLAEITHEGAVLEIGVGGGTSSVMRNRFMKSKSIWRPFFAIDTFSGFTREDIQFEKDHRGKVDDYPYYRSNSKEWYSKTLIAHGITSANVYATDAKIFDYAVIGPLAFCLFDVDLYKPTEIVLPRLYEILVPGGVIIVDDCSLEPSIYDGAGEAYRKFCSKMGFKEELHSRKARCHSQAPLGQ